MNNCFFLCQLQECHQLRQDQESAIIQARKATERADEAEAIARDARAALERCQDETRTIQESLRDDLAATHSNLVSNGCGTVAPVSISSLK